MVLDEALLQWFVQESYVNTRANVDRMSVCSCTRPVHVCIRTYVRRRVRTYVLSRFGRVHLCTYACTYIRFCLSVHEGGLDGVIVGMRLHEWCQETMALALGKVSPTGRTFMECLVIPQQVGTETTVEDTSDGGMLTVCVSVWRCHDVDVRTYIRPTCLRTCTSTYTCTYIWMCRCTNTSVWTYVRTYVAMYVQAFLR